MKGYWYDIPVALDLDPHVQALCERLRNPDASIYLIRLWRVVKVSAPDGIFEGPDIAGALERLVGFRGKRGRLIEALADNGFLERSDDVVSVYPWREVIQAEWLGAPAPGEQTAVLAREDFGAAGGDILCLSAAELRRARDRDKKRRKRAPKIGAVPLACPPLSPRLSPQASDPVPLCPPVASPSVPLACPPLSPSLSPMFEGGRGETKTESKTETHTNAGAREQTEPPNPPPSERPTETQLSGERSAYLKVYQSLYSDPKAGWDRSSSAAYDGARKKRCAQELLDHLALLATDEWGHSRNLAGSLSEAALQCSARIARGPSVFRPKPARTRGYVALDIDANLAGTPEGIIA